MILTNGQVYVDNSLLSTSVCETKMVMRHVHGYTSREEAVAAYCGQAIHEALADQLRGKTDELVLRKFKLLYEGYAAEYVPDNPKAPFYRLRYSNVEAILREYLVRKPLSTQPYSVRPGLVEVGFKVPLNDECVCGHVEERHDPVNGCQWRSKCGCHKFLHAFILYGRMDALVQADHDHGLYVLDHKSTKQLNSWKLEKWRMDSQMSGYTWAAQQTTGKLVAGILINAIQVDNLPSSDRKCKEHSVAYSECGALHARFELAIFTRTPDQLETWRRDAVRFARAYRELAKRIPTLDSLHDADMGGTFRDACSFCDFKDFCAGGRPTEYIEGMLVYSPWEPFDAKPKEEDEQ